MTMTAEDFLNALEQKKLVSHEIVANLRRQVTSAARPVAPAAIAKLLIDNGHLAAAQAQQLLSNGTSHAAPKPAVKPAEMELGLVDLDDDPAPAAKSASTVTKSAVTKGVAAKSSVGNASAGKSAIQSKSAIQKKPVPQAKPEPLAATDELVALDDLMPLDDLGTDDPLASLASGPDPFATLDPLAAAAASPALAPAGKVLAPQSKSGSKSQLLWGLLAFGGASVLVVAIAAGVYLTRGTGDVDYDLAEADFSGQQYDAAIPKYDSALSKYPRNARASTARVHRGLAQLLVARSASSQAADLLPVCKNVLAEIATEPDLPLIHAELAPLLTEMAAELADRVEQAKSPDERSARLAAAREALALTADGRLVPGELRAWQRLALIEESLTLVAHELARPNELDRTLVAMQQAIDAKKPADADELRAALLLAYPQVASDARLREIGQKLAESEAAAVQVTKVTSQPATTEATSPIVASLAIAVSEQVASGETYSPVFALAGGAIWGLDSRTGRLLWQRPLGAAASATPVTIAGDLLLFDARSNEVLRVEAATGTLRWRFPLPGVASGWPIVVDSHVVVATHSGQVIQLDAATGAPQNSVHLPQSPALSPVAGPGQVYLLAERGTLFVLSSSDLKCQQAIYVGHEAGNVRVPPAVLSHRLVVAENRGLASSRLVILRLDEQGKVTGNPQQLPLRGRVETPPVVLANHLVILTDNGGSAVFDIPSEAGKSLTRVGGNDGDPAELRTQYATANAGQLWIADFGVQQSALSANGKTLDEQWSAVPGSVLDSAPQVNSAGVFVVRREPGRPGAFATMLRPRNNIPSWQTQLAAPIVALASDASGKAITAVSATGAVVSFAAMSMPTSSVHISQLPTELRDTPAIAASVPLDKDRVLLIPAGEANELFVVQTSNNQAKRLGLPASLAGLPLVWRGGILAVTTSGSVHWLNPDTGAPLAEPFQLPMQIGSILSHCSLASEGDVAFLVSDGKRAMCRVGLKSEPVSHLAELGSLRLKSPIAGPLAIAGKTLLVVERPNSLRTYTLPDLTDGPSLPRSPGTVIFGPQSQGEDMLLATDHGELLCYGEDAKLKWQSALSGSTLCGVGRAADGSFIVATCEGSLKRIDASTGQELAMVDLQQPLTGQPVVVGNAVLVATTTGVVLKVTLPAGKGDAK